MLIISLLIFILGLCVGSFLNVCIYRIPKKESIVFGASHCTKCHTPIKPYDLIPLISYLLLGGKCRFCKNKLSIRYPLIELLTGVLYVVVFFIFGLSLKTLIGFLFVSILIVASFIDLDTLEVPNRLVLLILLLALIHCIFVQDVPLIENIIGFFAASVPFLLLAFLSHGGMGGGDIKLVAACGLLLGYKNILLGVFIGVLLAAVCGIILIFSKSKSLKSQLALVPFLSCGMVIAYLFGVQILEWYLSTYFISS